MSAATPPALLPSLPLLIGLTATERFTLRCDSYDATGAPRRASLFVTDWTLENTSVAAFNVRNVFEETMDLYGAPPPRPGDEWMTLQRMLTHENAGVERYAAGNIACVVAKHKHGHRLVDVRVPPTYDSVQLAPVPPGPLDVSVTRSVHWTPRWSVAQKPLPHPHPSRTKLLAQGLSWPSARTASASGSTAARLAKGGLRIVHVAGKRGAARHTATAFFALALQWARTILSLLAGAVACRVHPSHAPTMHCVAAKHLDGTYKCTRTAVQAATSS